MRWRCVVGLAAVLMMAPARAGAEGEGVRVELGLDMGWLIWGGSSVRGGPSNPTGGLVFVPSARFSLPLSSVWDLQYTQAPMVLAPGARQTGLVDANDFGIELHPPSRWGGVALAATVAPTYGAFCNVLWCLPEPLLAWGAAARGYLEVHSGAGGRAALVTVAARLLYAQPTAWTWPGLPEEYRRITPITVMFTGGGAWSL